MKTAVEAIFPGCTAVIEDRRLTVRHPTLLVASAIFDDENPVLFLNQLFIPMQHQRRGLGANVLRAAILVCQANRLKRIECIPTAGGGILQGVAFCNRHGFKRVEGSARMFLPSVVP